MYYEYFGFRQPPFRITPDTNLFYPGGERGAVLDALVYAILNGEGIVKVVGEVGSGKTMLCRMLERELPDKVEVVYLANPSLSPENTLHAITFELGLDVPREATRFEIMNRLQEYLLQRHSQDRQVVVFVEEAQAMPLATLEEIRLLSNLETQHNKLLQIVLFGQPELDEMIATPEIRQLKERITYSFRLNPFENQDIRDYLNSRIRACGYRADALFDRAAVSEIEGYSRGLLRRINILADKALLAAYAENTHRVTSKHIRKAASDSEFASDARRSRWRRPALVLAGGLALVLLVILAAWLAGFGPGPAWRPGVTAGDQAQAARGNSDTRLATADTAGQAAARTPAVVSAPAVPEEPPDRPAPDQENSENTDSNVTPEEAVAEPSGQPRGVGEDTGGSATGEPPAGGQAQPGDDNDAGNAKPAVRAYTVIELSGLDEVGLSGKEAAALRRQLETVPPESIVLSGHDPDQAICDRCRSLVYRPVKSVENL